MAQEEGFASPAINADGATTTQPERDLQPGDPNLLGAAPAEEKKGIKGRVKGLIGRHGRRKDALTPPGKAAKMREKVERKVGHEKDQEKHGPAQLLMSSGSSMSSSDEEDIGTVGFALDPTGPAVAGRNLGRRDFTSAPAGPGADFSKINLNPNANAAAERHAKRAAEYAEWSNPMTPDGEVTHGDEHNRHPHDSEGAPNVERNLPSQSNINESEYAGGDERDQPLRNETRDSRGDERRPSLPRSSNESGQEQASYGGVESQDLIHQKGDAELPASDEVERHSSTPVGTTSDEVERHSSAPDGSTNSEGGAVLGDHEEGPRDDNVKQEGFMAKVMDTFRSPKDEPAASATH